MYQRIKDLREDNDLRQADVACHLNMSQQNYSKIEKGITEITADYLIMLAQLYNTSTDYILGLTDEK